MKPGGGGGDQGEYETQTGEPQPGPSAVRGHPDLVSVGRGDVVVLRSQV